MFVFWVVVDTARGVFCILFGGCACALRVHCDLGLRGYGLLLNV